MSLHELFHFSVYIICYQKIIASNAVYISSLYGELTVICSFVGNYETNKRWLNYLEFSICHIARLTIQNVVWNAKQSKP